MLNPYQMAEYYRQVIAEEAAAQAPPRVAESRVGVVELGGPPNVVEITEEQFREYLATEAQLAAEKADKLLIVQLLQIDRLVREHINAAVHIDDARTDGEDDDSSGQSFDPDGSDSGDSGVIVLSDDE